MNSASLNSSVQEPTRTPVNNVQELDSEDQESDLELQEPDSLDTVWDEIDPSCECGVGTLLGSIRGTPMYYNHEQIESFVVPVKPKINYLLPIYFSMLKEMELLTENSSLCYVSKILNLLKIWKKFQFTIADNHCSRMDVFLHFGISESAVLVLQPMWEKGITLLKGEFIKTMEQITHTMRILKFVEEVKMCTNFVYILKNPWNHKYISCIIKKYYPSYENMGDLLKFERSTILLHRLNLLCKTKHQEVEAMKCAFLATHYYEKNLINDRNQTFFLEEDYECIRDIYYVLLLKFDKRQMLVKILQNYNPKTRGIKLIQRYYSKIKHLASLSQEDRPFFHDIQVILYEVAATVIVNNSLCSKNMDQIVCKLMHYWTDIVIVLRDSDLNNGELISRSNTLTNESFFKLCIYDFIKNAASFNYLYLLCHILYDKFGLKLPGILYVVINIHILINYIKSKAYCTLESIKEKLFQLSNSSVEGFFKLADLFKDVLIVFRESILTDNTLNVKTESVQVLDGNETGEVAQLSRKLPDPCAEIIAKLFSFIFLLGINIVYWLLMSNFLYYSVGYIYDLLYEDKYTGAFEFNTTNLIIPNNASYMNDTLTTSRPLSLYQSIWDFNSTVSIFLVIIVAPLLNFRSATFFTKFNSLDILSVVYLFSFVLIKSYGCGMNLSLIEGSGEFFELHKNTLPATSGMLTLSLFIHNIIISIMRNNGNQKHILLTVYPLICSYMLRVQVFTALEVSLYSSFLQFIPHNYFLIFKSIWFAIFMPHIATVIRFSGAICGFVFICTLPTMFHLASQRGWNLLTTGSIVFHITISLIGLANLIA